MNVRSIMVRFTGLRVGVVAAVATAACTKVPKSEAGATQIAAKPGSNVASVATFDGLSVGGTFDRARAPYNNPCDSDPLDGEPNITIMFYTGKECRHQQFPDGTSVIVLVDRASSKISALAWVGGTYFDSRNAPLKTGTPVAEAVTAWGPPAAEFHIHTMHVMRFANGTRVLSNWDHRIIGFAFGDWPDAIGQRWDPLDQVNRRYTAPVFDVAVSEEDCKAVTEHVAKLSGLNLTANQADIDDCRAHTTTENAKCIIAAKDRDDVEKCFRRRWPD
jgi:hypothetical protein